MEFRGLTLKEAIGTFSEAAYGKRLDFVMRSISPRKGTPIPHHGRPLMLTVKGET